MAGLIGADEVTGGDEVAGVIGVNEASMELVSD